MWNKYLPEKRNLEDKYASFKNNYQTDGSETITLLSNGRLTDEHFSIKWPI